MDCVNFIENLLQFNEDDEVSTKASSISNDSPNYKMEKLKKKKIHQKMNKLVNLCKMKRIIIKKRKNFIQNHEKPECKELSLKKSN